MAFCEGGEMRKLTVVLITVALCLSITFVAHGVVTGVGLPYPDPTPEQAAYERFHRGVSQPLFLVAGASWLAAGVSAAMAMGHFLMRRKQFKSVANANGGESTLPGTS